MSTVCRYNKKAKGSKKYGKSTRKVKIAKKKAIAKPTELRIQQVLKTNGTQGSMQKPDGCAEADGGCQSQRRRKTNSYTD